MAEKRSARNSISVIEEIVKKMTDMIEKSKPSPLSSSKVIINKEEFLALIRELDMKAPGEIERYRKMLKNRDAIMADAQDRADKIVEEAHMSIQNMIDEHEIVQQALQEADNIVEDATAQANEILYEANKEAEMLRRGSTRYTIDNLTKMQNLVNATMQNFDSRYRSMMSTMEKYSELLKENKEELLGRKETKPAEEQQSLDMPETQQINMPEAQQINMSEAQQINMSEAQQVNMPAEPQEGYLDD